MDAATFAAVLSAGKQAFSPAKYGLAQRDLIGVWDPAISLAGLSNGAAVAKLPDLSGFSHDLIQSSSSFQPTKQAGPNGAAVLRFAATQRLANTLLGAGFPDPNIFPQPLTFIAVAKTSSANTNFPLIAGGLGTGGTAGVFVDQTRGCAYPYAGASGPIVGPHLTDDAWHVIVVTMDTMSSATYIDGWLASSAGTQSHSTDGLSQLWVGNKSAGSSQWLGDLRFLAILRSSLTPGQVEALSATLAAKVSVTPGKCAAAASPWETQVSGSSQNIRLWVPPVPSTPTTLVQFCHKQSGNEQVAPGNAEYGLVAACMARGWYFAASAMHGGDNWGNDSSVTDLLDVHNLVAARAGTIARHILIAESMGGMGSSMAVANSTIPNLKGVYCLDAAFNLAGQYANASYTSSVAIGFALTQGTLSSAASSGATSISSSVSFPSGTSIRIDPSGTNPETVTTTGAPTGSGPYAIPVPALGFAHSSGVVVSDYPVKAAGHDPLLKSANSYSGVRWRFHASTADTLTPKAANTDAMRTLLASATTPPAEYALVSRTVSGHLGGDAFEPADLVAFVDRC